MFSKNLSFCFLFFSTSLSAHFAKQQEKIPFDAVDIATITDIIGPSKAKLIGAYLQKNNITRITELLRIKGIGKKTVIELQKNFGTRFGYEPMRICGNQKNRC